MNFKIIVDSCCDLTKELKEKLGAITIPLTLNLGNMSFRDDDALDLPVFMKAMKQCTAKVGSSAPAPALYEEAFEGEHTSFAVTLSSKLSGSYLSALVGKRIAEEKKADVHVFDSQSASSGEVLVALKIHELINKGLQKTKIIENVEHYIAGMKTYFVLERMDNLIKNGRLNKVMGRLVNALNIRSLMKSDGKGEIALHGLAHGPRQVIEKLTDTIAQSGKRTEEERMVIAHCNNPDLAERLKEAIANRYQFKDILVLPTKGLSSLYADDKGLVMSF